MYFFFLQVKSESFLNDDACISDIASLKSILKILLNQKQEICDFINKLNSSVLYEVYL